MFRFLLYPFNLIIDSLEGVGRYVELMMSLFRSIFSWHKYLSLTIDQLFHIGVLSIPIVILTSLFSGMVTSVQAAYQFESGFVPNWFVGSIVGESVLLELAPMMTALVMTGRIGATIAAEIGTMRVTEQIDALITLSTNPFKYLVAPRLFAGVLTLPILVLVADIIGILGGYIVSSQKLGLNPTIYLQKTALFLEPFDIISGLIKAAVFGFIISLMGCYHGYHSEGGARGVGNATTNAVVSASVLILGCNYLITELHFVR